MSYPVMLGAIVIDSSNRSIVITEAGADVTAQLGGAATVTGSITCYLRGDGTSDDLCKVIKDAMEAAGASANTYTVSVSFSVDGTATSAAVTIARATGADSIGIKWASASTTFDEALIGFANTNVTGATSYTSTLSPSSVWVSSEVYRELEPESDFVAFSQRARSGRVWGGLRGGAYAVRRLGLDLLHAKRAHSVNNSTDPDSGLDQFLERQLAGLAFELHVGTISSGTTLAALSSSTEHGSGWYFDAESLETYAPRRQSPGVPLFSVDLRLLGYVA